MVCNQYSENLIKEVIRDIGSRLVGLNLKGILMSELFTMSRNSLALEEAVPPESARSHMSKYQNTENKRHG